MQVTMKGTIRLDHVHKGGRSINRALKTSLFSVITAQMLKVPIEYLQTRRWNIGAMFTPGGMPSSHSAAVSSLATFVGFKRGFTSIDFSISALLGLIVMYDASGVRRHAGETAIVVNDLEESIEKLAESHPELSSYRKREKELKERLGHLPSEVVAGALYGIAVGALSYWLKRK